MDQTSVARKLDAGRDEDKIKQQINNARVRGINSVPYFVINDRYKLSGAQPVEKLLEVFDHVTKGQ
jgi:predicted DsbA family dithiol-disulfide isomerase